MSVGGETPICAMGFREMLVKSKEVLKRCSLNVGRNAAGKFSVKNDSGSFCDRATSLVDKKGSTFGNVASW